MTSQIFAHCIVCTTCAKDVIDLRGSLESQARRIAGLQLQIKTKDDHTTQLQRRITQLEAQLMRPKAATAD